jgi:tRNA1Val (adenine37-N6)-methyltransferase
MFRFKQFAVAHDKCALKVNTDGVLLGAWANADGARTILDIGTGTGVIALMMAQKNKQAIIDALDIDREAYWQAKENFENSAWSGRLNGVLSSLQTFNTAKRYDVIISNPPYFVDDLKTANEQKNLAKHSTGLSYAELIDGISYLLSDNGKAYLVIPVFNFQLVREIAEKRSLYVNKVARVIAVKGKPPYLSLLELNWKKREYSDSVIEIQDDKGEFTEQYRELTKDFYLKF